MIIFILFCIKGKESTINKIDEVIYKKFTQNEEKNIKNNSGKISGIKIEKQEEKINNKKDHLYIKNNSNKNNKRKSKRKLSHTNSKISSNFNLVNKENNLDLINNESQYKNIKEKIVTIDNDTIQTEEKPDLENDYELNTLSYSMALKYDKRQCCDYYSSQLKNKQLFLFTFCSFNDYNSKIIKRFIFFLSFAIHYTISALFFTDSNMHQIFLDGGNYNISYQMPFILISAVASTVLLRIMLEALILTDRNILQVKYQLTKTQAEEVKKNVLKCINIKYFFFFIINFILLILFWFYLTCFNDTYENTQIYLIENTFISFGISFFYPFIWNIIPSALRMIALDTKKPDRNCIYIVSKICQWL